MKSSIDDRSCSANEPFALRVLDDSMAPEFPAGCVVLVDPGGQPAADGFAVIETDSGFVLRGLRRDASGALVACLGDGNQDFVIEDRTRVLGTITQRAGRRRSMHRRY